MSGNGLWLIAPLVDLSSVISIRVWEPVPKAQSRFSKKGQASLMRRTSAPVGSPFPPQQGPLEDSFLQVSRIRQSLQIPCHGQSCSTKYPKQPICCRLSALFWRTQTPQTGFGVPFGQTLNKRHAHTQSFRIWSS